MAFEFGDKRFGDLQVEDYLFWKGQKLPLKEFVIEYRRLYRAAMQLFTEHDPCQIHDSTCIRGRETDGYHFCCTGCEYLAENGCTTDSIWCKLWTCYDLKENESFWERRRQLVDYSDKLCRSHGGRYGLDIYIQRFYGPEEYEQWKATEISSNNTCVSSANS